MRFHSVVKYAQKKRAITELIKNNEIYEKHHASCNAPPSILEKGRPVCVLNILSLLRCCVYEA